jgi:type I restriction enzyme S subunit
MSRAWSNSTLVDLTEFISRGISPTYMSDGGVLVLNQKCIRGHSINYDLGRRHDSAAKPVAQERLLSVGDILINSTGTGTLGRVAQLREEPPEPTTVDSHITIVRPKSALVCREFLGYSIIAIEDKLKESGDGCGGQTELARSRIANGFEIRFPTSVSEQQRIVEILDEALRSIEVSRARTETSLASARELSESFLNNIFATSKSVWTDTFFGDKSVLSIIDGDRGANYPKRDEFHENGFCLFLNTANVRPDGFLFNSSMFITEEKDRLLRKGRLTRDDVVITTRGTVGNVGLYSHAVPFERVRINSGMLILRANPDVLLPEFLYIALQSNAFKKQAKARTSGAAQPQLPIATLITLSLRFPRSLAEQIKIIRALELLRPKAVALVDVYFSKLAALDELKQSLLHAAFSGDLTSTKVIAA